LTLKEEIKIMQLNDEIVSGWLSGSDSIGGYENPAGPLYIQGRAATEAAMTDRSQGMMAGTLQGGTTCSLARGCACC
jgi:hypothetical protein